MPDNILALQDDFELFIFDIYGVLWNGKSLIDGVPERLAALKKAGKKVILLSNGTERAAQLEESQTRRGLVKGIHYDGAFSSGELAHRTFCADKRPLKYYNFGRPADILFAGSPYQKVATPEKADFVYIGVPQLLEGENWRDVLTLEPFVAELERLRKLDKVLVCANPDLRAYGPQLDDPVVRQGSVARYYEEIGGEVEYFGKPYPEVYLEALSAYENVAPEKMLMVGDTLETDVLGAASLGIKTLFISTGMSRYYMESEGNFDRIEDYAADLKIIPDYIMESI